MTRVARCESGCPSAQTGRPSVGTLSPIAHQLQEIAVRIEEVEALVIAPVDRRVIRDGALREQSARAFEVIPRDLERVVALAEGILDLREAARRAIGHEEQRTVAVAVAEQPLIRQPHLDAHAEHVHVEALCTVEIADVDAEVIEAPDLDHGFDVAAFRQWTLISARGATQTRGVWRT